MATTISNSKKQGAFRDYFTRVEQYLEIKVPDRGGRAILFHYPIDEWNGMFHKAVHFHGHQHIQVKKARGGRLDVGVDSNQLMPYELNEAYDLAFATVLDGDTIANRKTTFEQSAE